MAELGPNINAHELKMKTEYYCIEHLPYSYMDVKQSHMPTTKRTPSLLMKDFHPSLRVVRLDTTKAMTESDWVELQRKRDTLEAQTMSSTLQDLIDSMGLEHWDEADSDSDSCLEVSEHKEEEPEQEVTAAEDTVLLNDPTAEPIQPNELCGEDQVKEECTMGSDILGVDV